MTLNRFCMIIAMLLITMGIIKECQAKEDYTLETLTTVAMVADWGTTLDIENHQDIYESNPIMGKHPTRATVNTYFISKLVLHYYINRWCEPCHSYREYWNFVQFSLSADAVLNNYQLGLKINF